ncbi:MAG: flavodoxin domain-containing protein [Treponema sp.]|jgi:menaquinone-dependent protoporphyrinogen oxidase|nr:flavodoxin domain-containing protein [Treponema sp.]
MKTIILYATKYGTAEAAARRIADKIDDEKTNAACVIHNLKQNIPSLADFDCVIIGSSVYAGMIRKEAKTFLAQNADSLLEKKLGLFLCGIAAEGEKKYFEDNFSVKLLQAAKAKCFAGGIFDPKKNNAAERFIIKIAAKKTEYTDTIDEEKINQFAQAMKS